MNNSVNQKVFLNGHIDVPKSRIEAVETALATHISLTRAEEGCISFNVRPSDSIENRFMVSEVFVNQSAFDAHQERTKKSDWFKTTEGIPREYEITVEGEE